MTTPYIGRLALGNVGVFMFFVLSGFVIFEALDIFYKDSIKRFLINRFLRIFPTYWASLAFAMLALYAISSPKLANLDSLTVLMNISLVGFYFSSPTIDSPFVISVAWAVIVEILFYLGRQVRIGSQEQSATPIMPLLGWPLGVSSDIYFVI